LGYARLGVCGLAVALSWLGQLAYRVLVGGDTTTRVENQHGQAGET